MVATLATRSLNILVILHVVHSYMLIWVIHSWSTIIDSEELTGLPWIGTRCHMTHMKFCHIRRVNNCVLRCVWDGAMVNVAVQWKVNRGSLNRTAIKKWSASMHCMALRQHFMQRVQCWDKVITVKCRYNILDLFGQELLNFWAFSISSVCAFLISMYVCFFTDNLPVSVNYKGMVYTNGQTFTMSLGQYETFQSQSRGDLTGARIIADQPVSLSVQ